MAKFQCEGLDALAKNVQGLQQDNKELVKNMLKAGEKPVIKAWQDNMNKVIMHTGTEKQYVRIRRGKFQRFKAKSRSTGATAKAIKGTIKLTGTAVGTNDIYPKGIRGKSGKKKVRHADVAFIFNYGKKGQIGTKFVDTAVTGSEKDCVEEMEKVFNDFLKKKGLV